MWEFAGDGPFDCVCEKGDGLEEKEESAGAEGQRGIEERVFGDAEGTYQERHHEIMKVARRWKRRGKTK